MVVWVADTIWTLGQLCIKHYLAFNINFTITQFASRVEVEAEGGSPPPTCAWLLFVYLLTWK